MAFFRPGRLARRSAAALVALGSLIFVGCGGGSSSPASKTPSEAKPFVPVLVDQLVAQDAYIATLYSNAAGTVPVARGILGHWAGALHAERLALASMRVPARAQNAYASFGVASRNLTLALERVRRQRSIGAIQGLLGPALNPAITKFQSAEVAFRKSLGIPAYAWFSAQRSGPLAYSDSLSAPPHSHLRWVLGPNVRYGDGGLILNTVNSTGLTGPITNYSFDRRHISIEVDATVAVGSPSVGILCPPFRAQRQSYMLGQIGPGARYSFGLLRVRRSAYLLLGPNSSSAIKSSGVNHLRLDCDQYSPRFATARLYVNGKLLDTDSLPGKLSATRDGGLLVGMRHGAATAIFKNWKVSKLSSGR
jgi:hypothetical protein